MANCLFCKHRRHHGPCLYRHGWFGPRCACPGTLNPLPRIDGQPSAFGEAFDTLFHNGAAAKLAAHFRESAQQLRQSADVFEAFADKLEGK